MTTFTGDGTNNSLSGTASADDLYGLGGADVLYGQGGNDTLDGGTGIDTMYGGTGDDVYFVDDFNDSVRENPGEGTWDTIVSTVSYALYAQHGANVENLFLAGNADLTGVGDDQANGIFGNTGANLLVGNGGNDSLFGFSDVSFEGITPPVAYGSVDGNDTLDGGAGSDLMFGGAGNDVYFVDSVGDRVYEFAGEGDDDVVVSSVSYSAAAMGALSAVETVYLAGNANINATGNTSNNYLVGNTGANLLLGNEGNDTLMGFGDMSIELGLATPIAYGAVDGNDTLDGGIGADLMAGGTGNDVYYVDSAGDTVFEFTGGGTDDVIISSVSYTMSFSRGREVESIYLAGSSNLNITGDAGHNKLYGNTGANQISGGDGNDYLVGYGNVTTARGLATPLAYGTVDGNDTLDGGAGNDTLDGGTGSDLLTGGAGDDYYIVDSSGDVVQESDTVSGGAWDVVDSSVSYSLMASSATAGVEGLILSGAALIGGGNALNNGIAGNEQANSLYGEDGNDTIYGFGGNDSVWGGNGQDVLAGDGGNDVLYGEAGNDVLEGGEGNDTLQGGTGNDAYVFYSGFGSDLINNASTTSVADLDVVQFGDASYNSLWFKQVGNNLEISEVGTTDKVQVQNWFSDSTARVDQFLSLGSGMQLDSSKVAGLVSAMAGFSPQDMSSGAPSALIAARDTAWQTISA